LGVGLKGVPFLLAVGERIPFQEIIQGLVRVADPGGPEAGLLDAVLLPDPQGNRVKALQQVRQAARHGVVDAQLVQHVSASVILPTRSLSDA
jgi:hypothetical protein